MEELSAQFEISEKRPLPAELDPSLTQLSNIEVVTKQHERSQCIRANGDNACSKGSGCESIFHFNFIMKAFEYPSGKRHDKGWCYVCIRDSLKQK